MKYRLSLLFIMITMLVILSSCGYESRHPTSVSSDPDILHSSPPSSSITEPDSTPSPLLETYSQALLSKIPFSFTSQESHPISLNEMYLSEITTEDTQSMSPPRFAVLDMDGDGMLEVVYERSDYAGFLILRYNNGEIYAYDVNYRAMMGLKEDGSSSASSGSDSVSFGKIRFLDNYYDLDKVVYSIGTHYYSGGEEISRSAFDERWGTYETLTDVNWHEYTEETVGHWLPRYFDQLDLASEVSPSEMQIYQDSLSTLLFLNYNSNDFRGYFEGWNQAMNAIYELYLESLEGSDKETLENDQQQWLNNRSIREQIVLSSQDTSLGDMTKYRTYQLISLYFKDTFYFFE